MSQSYADIAHERDELKSEIEMQKSIMDRMLEKGKKLDEENERFKTRIKEVNGLINTFCKKECRSTIKLCESCLLLKIKDTLNEVQNEQEAKN